MELFCENNQKLLVENYFCKKGSALMFAMVLNTLSSKKFENFKVKTLGD